MVGLSNTTTQQREFARPPLRIEGAVTRLWYASAGNTSAVELLRNYQNDLRSAGFTVLYDSTKDPAATNWTNYFAPYASLSPKLHWMRLRSCYATSLR